MFENSNLVSGMNGAMEHNHDHDSTTSGDMDMSHDHTMKMYFHTDVGIDYVFFKQWKPSNACECIGTCIFLCVLAICYEALKSYRDYLLTHSRDYTNRIRVSSDRTSDGERIKIGIGRHMISFAHFIQTLLHMIQFFVSYLLMLAFMTYNAYFCTAILIGAGMGYFIFGWYKSTAVDTTEHCH